MTEKNDFSFFSNENAEQHVTGGISFRTAYILDPRVKGHPKNIFSKIKKNKQKKIFFSKKNSCPTACYAVRIESNPPAFDVPRSLHQPGKKKFQKKLEMTDE